MLLWLMIRSSAAGWLYICFWQANINNVLQRSTRPISYIVAPHHVMVVALRLSVRSYLYFASRMSRVRKTDVTWKS